MRAAGNKSKMNLTINFFFNNAVCIGSHQINSARSITPHERKIICLGLCNTKKKDYKLRPQDEIASKMQKAKVSEHKEENCLPNSDLFLLQPNLKFHLW